jgi:hypothetical protein
MILYTIQDYFIFESLQRGETHRAHSPSLDTEDPGSVDDMYCRSYDWIAGRMEEKIGPRPAPEVYPTWAYYQWYGPDKKKPDLRYWGTRSFAASRTCALMTLEIPDEQVLVSDYDAWHFVLNGWYLGDEKRSDELWDIKNANKNWREYDDYPQWLKNELEESWLNVFDFKKSRELLEYEEKEQVIQATFWEIKPEYVKSAVKFDRTGKTTKLL